jgi:AcrR family transcriptional regulator
MSLASKPEPLALMPAGSADAEPLPEQRSQRIVEAAYELLDEAGLEGLTIRAVLKRTGLSRRAFYERFVGKDELMLAVFERTIRLAAENFGAQFAALPDPIQRLKRVVTQISLGSSLSGTDSGQGNRRDSASRAAGGFEPAAEPDRAAAVRRHERRPGARRLADDSGRAALQPGRDHGAHRAASRGNRAARSGTARAAGPRHLGILPARDRRLAFA